MGWTTFFTSLVFFAHDKGYRKEVMKLAKSKKEIEKDERISAEIKRLNDILKNIHESKRNSAKRLIENIAFMSVVLEELQVDIKKRGETITTTNGNGFKVIVENPSMKSYNATVNRFTAATRQLFDLLPKDLPSIIPVEQEQAAEQPKDALQSFHEKYNRKI